MTGPAPIPAADLPALASYAAAYGLDAEAAAAEWKFIAEDERAEWRAIASSAEAAGAIIRDVLESLCRRDGLSLESRVVPGGPARNYELADRLGIGHVFGLQPTAPDTPGRPTTSLEEAMLRNIDQLGDLIRDMLQSLPDTADEQEWRDRAGMLHVCDPDGRPYRARTQGDL